MCNYCIVKDVILMPDFDSTSPLQRGQVTGRKLGPCNQAGSSCNIRKEGQKKKASSGNLAINPLNP
jgi:hypothetical protein